MGPAWRATLFCEFCAFDFHLNGAATILSVTTPSSGSIDPRQVGVRPTGTYWGGGGEQIDMRSGNLNYTTPILTAMGRGGWGATFSSDIIHKTGGMTRLEPGNSAPTWATATDGICRRDHSSRCTPALDSAGICLWILRETK